MATSEHGGDLPTTRMENGQTLTSFPGLRCSHCPAAFYKTESKFAHEKEKHPGQPYSHSAEDETHRIDYYHYLNKQTPHFFVLHDKKSGKIVSNLTLDEEGKVQGVETHPEFRRQGLATKLWDYAKSRSDIGIPEPKHSSMRTREGEAWAKKIGGDLPKRGRLLSARQMQGMIDFERQ